MSATVTNSNGHQQQRSPAAKFTRRNGYQQQRLPTATAPETDISRNGFQQQWLPATDTSSNGHQLQRLPATTVTSSNGHQLHHLASAMVTQKERLYIPTATVNTKKSTIIATVTTSNGYQISPGAQSTVINKILGASKCNPNRSTPLRIETPLQRHSRVGDKTLRIRPVRWDFWTKSRKATRFFSH